MRLQHTRPEADTPYPPRVKNPLLTARGATLILCSSIPRTVRICTPLFFHNFDFH